MRIKARSNRRLTALIVCACVLTLAGSFRAQATARKEALPCPGCVCVRAIADTTEDIDTFNIAGCILGADQTIESIRVRILGVRSTEVLTTRANTLGQFSFKNVPNGDYVLVATQGRKTLAMTTIRLPFSAPVVMDVEPFKTGGPRIQY
jgi:hypothetical protein